MTRAALYGASAADTFHGVHSPENKNQAGALQNLSSFYRLHIRSLSHSRHPVSIKMGNYHIVPLL